MSSVHVSAAPWADSVELVERTCVVALECAREYLATLRESVRIAGPVGPEDPAGNQAMAHGYAWAATYVAGLEQLSGWAATLRAAGRFHELERLILQAGFGEYLAQMAGGIAMSQGEYFRAEYCKLDAEVQRRFADNEAVAALRRWGFDRSVRRRIAQLCVAGTQGREFGAQGLDSFELLELQRQFGRFADAHADDAQSWHLLDEFIPMPVLEELARMGAFAITIPQEFDGLDLGKLAMCVMTEELSRGYLGMGSLGTRSEIAGELITMNGTPAQKARYLPGLANGSIIPTAVFTEPDVGSDLGSIKTRARRVEGGWRVYGSKMWITHGARSDLMTLLVRTDPENRGASGISLFLADKPRGTDENPFPAEGMAGSEIRVLGYRGMKEYDIAFDGYFLPDDALLGGLEGAGFKQLMQTFESARIQTAARGVGVAQNAFEMGLRYAQQRTQFGRPIVEFPRIADKLAWMAVEITIARQLTYFAARQKDLGIRCDVVGGMAKMLSARVAWSNADNALQIHGGAGYALESPVSRLMCDARVLSIFEGAAEIQAEVISRGLLR